MTPHVAALADIESYPHVVELLVPRSRIHTVACEIIVAMLQAKVLRRCMLEHQRTIIAFESVPASHAATQLILCTKYNLLGTLKPLVERDLPIEQYKMDTGVANSNRRDYAYREREVSKSALYLIKFHSEKIHMRRTRLPRSWHYIKLCHHSKQYTTASAFMIIRHIHISIYRLYGEYYGSVPSCRCLEACCILSSTDQASRSPA